MRRTLDVTELDFVGRKIRADAEREFCAQKHMILVPVDSGGEIETRRALAQRDGADGGCIGAKSGDAGGDARAAGGLMNSGKEHSRFLAA